MHIIETNLIRVNCSVQATTFTLKHLNISNKIKHFTYKDGCGVHDMGVIRVSRCFKEELARATDKCLEVTSNIMLLNPLIHNLQLTGLKTVSQLIANARKLVLYASLCINCHNMKTEKPTEKL